MSGKTGRADVAHLPVGEWNFQLWHEKAGYLQDVRLNGQQVTGKKGVYTWKVGPGENRILSVQVSAKVFQSDR